MLAYNSTDYPQSPGVYLMRSASDEVLYVGKAKDLRRRIAAYFRPGGGLGPRTRAMVERVDRVEVLCTATEKEALLLESGLIKKHRPRYNIVLRDDKSFLLFRLDHKADYPALTLTRRVKPDGARYFGPFTSALAARKTWKLVNRLFQLRKCSERNFRNRVRPCLQHHMGRCLGPCVLPVSRETYGAILRRVELFLQGRTRELLHTLEQEMWAASERLEFERAQHRRDQIEAVRRSLEGQAVVLHREQDLDIFGLSPTEEGVALSVLFIRQGRLVDQECHFWPEVSVPELDPQAGPEQGAWELLQDFLPQFYGRERLAPERILISEAAFEEHALEELLSEQSGVRVRIAVPRGVQERSLARMARKNAAEYARQQQLFRERISLAEALGLSEEPDRIEAVDVSHLAGQGTYAACTRFEGGRPLKAAYRLYRFADEETGGDDYRTLYLWMKRRLAAGPPWPDLVLVDGGKGQLASVAKALDESGIEDRLELAAIAKSGRSGAAGGDRIFRPGRKNPLPLRKGSPELLFLQQVRDETHRFVIGAQRRSRKGGVTRSALLGLPGIGPWTARQLLDRFGTLEAVLAATEEEIRTIPGMGGKRAGRIREALAGAKSADASPTHS
jgi:excinuclease ABC subunit C